MQSYTSFFFFLCLLLRRGLWASEFELRVLLLSPGQFGTLLFLNDSPLVLFEVLLELDITRLSACLALFGANERGGGIRTRASLWRCKTEYVGLNTRKCKFQQFVWALKKTETPLIKYLVLFITWHARCCPTWSTGSWFPADGWYKQH